MLDRCHLFCIPLKFTNIYISIWINRSVFNSFAVFCFGDVIIWKLLYLYHKLNENTCSLVWYEMHCGKKKKRKEMCHLTTLCRKEAFWAFLVSPSLPSPALSDSSGLVDCLLSKHDVSFHFIVCYFPVRISMWNHAPSTTIYIPTRLTICSLFHDFMEPLEGGAFLG